MNLFENILNNAKTAYTGSSFYKGMESLGSNAYDWANQDPIQKYLDDPKIEYTKKQNLMDNLKSGVPKEVITSYINENVYKQPQFRETLPMVSPTFPATGNEGVIGGTAKMIGNIPSSLYNLGAGTVNIASTAAQEGVGNTASMIGKGIVRSAGQGAENLSQAYQQGGVLGATSEAIAGAQKMITQDPSLLFAPQMVKGAGNLTKMGGKAIVRGAEAVAPKIVQPVKNLGGTIGQKYKGARQYLSGLDEKEISAIEKASASEMDAIIKQAKSTQGKQGDYVQTPYHVGATKAQKTLNQLDKDLKTRQAERLALLDEAPIAKIDAKDARMALKSSLRSMNVEDIRIIDGKPEIIPVKGREALLDLSNPADVKALQKLNEILDGDVSPTQTMDRVKKLQEWAYENKSTIGVKGTSERMDGLIRRVQGSLNATFKKQLPEEYAKILDSMSEDINLSNEVKKAFGIDDNGVPVGNRGEMVMKRLANGTTTGGEARTIAKKIFDRYGIDLIKEARLRQMAMDLVGDSRGQTLFGAIQKGKSGIMDLAIQKTLGKLVNKEGIVRSLARGKGEKIKATKPLYTPNPFRKAMAEEIKKPLALPAPSGKATGARNVRVNQPMDKSVKIKEKVNPNVKRPGTKSTIKPSLERQLEDVRIRKQEIKDMINEAASNTNAARYGGTGNTRVESFINGKLANGKLTKEEALAILEDAKTNKKYSYMDYKRLDEYIKEIKSGKKKDTDIPF